MIYKMDNKINLKDIIAPSLNSTEYAKNLSDVFENIHYNFIALANRDFVKGETGDSLDAREVEIKKDGDFYNLLKECIYNYIDKNNGENSPLLEDLKNEGTAIANIFDIIKENPPKIWMIYGKNKEIENSVYKPITSLPFIFLDGRFNIDGMGDFDNLNQYNYNSIKNASCIIVYDCNENDGNGGFRVLDNAFPSLYVDKNNGFCWKINGVETGISATGLQGKTGNPWYMVYCNDMPYSVGDFNSVAVNSIYDVEKGEIYTKPSTVDRPYDDLKKIIEYNNVPCLVCVGNNLNDNTDNTENFYFGMGILNVTNKDTSNKNPLWRLECKYCKYNDNYNNLDILNFINEYITSNIYNKYIKECNSQIKTINSDLNGEEGIKYQLTNIKDNYLTVSSVIGNMVSIIGKLEQRISELEKYHLPPTEPENPGPENPETT